MPYRSYLDQTVIFKPFHWLASHNLHQKPLLTPNTAKLSSPILLPRTVSYDASSKPPSSSGTYRVMTERKTGRRRRSSSLLYQEPPETIEHMSDQAALPNLNANWVNAKGQSSLYTTSEGAVEVALQKGLFSIWYLILVQGNRTSWSRLQGFCFGWKANGFHFRCLDHTRCHYCLP